MSSVDATKIRFPVQLVAALLLALIPAVGTWAVAAERLAQVEKRTAALEENDRVRQREAEQQRLDTQLIKQAVQNIAEMVKETRQDVKDLKRER